MTGPVRRLRLAARAIVRGEPKIAAAALPVPANGSASGPAPPPPPLPVLHLVCSSPQGRAGGDRYIAFHSPQSAVDAVFVAASEPIESVLSTLSTRWPGRPLEVHIPVREVSA